MKVGCNDLGRDSVVSITICYGLNGPGIESRWLRGLPYRPSTALGRTQPQIKWVPGIFPGIKPPRRGVDQIFQSSAKVKERVELTSSWRVQGELDILSCNDKFQYHSVQADNSDNGVLIL